MNQKNTLPPADQQEVEIDLRELFGYYMSKLPMLIIAIVIGALVAGLVTVFLITDKYTASSKMYMVSASSDSVVNLSDLNLGTSLSSDYAELMTSRPVIEEVIEKLNLKYEYEDVVDMLSLTVVNDTRIIRISATSTDPQEAMNIANQLARTAKSRLPKVMDAPSPSIVEDAVLPTVPSSPSLKKNVLLGALGLLVVILAILTVRFLLDDTLKTAEDVEKEFGIMPLSVVPEGEIAGLKSADDPKESRKRRRYYKKKSRKGGQA
ncbi:MAG: capsular polysaccharide biosynthesis protein [Eubacterium sp.]|nr:capsular polysaccharide biosynthesis protein [Eubacterium sp.]